MSARLLYIVTHALSADLLGDQLVVMKEAGYHVGFVSAPGPQHDQVAKQGVDTFSVPMAREISIVADLKALLRLIRIMRKWRPDIVNAGTPKAGLLGMLAATLTGVPARVYVLRGLRTETTSGLKRLVLELTERVASACAHRVIAVSPSLAQRYVELRLAPPRKVRLLGRGSSKGVESMRFACPDAAAVASLRERLELPAGVPVVGFVGRVTRDKGIVDLLDAVDRVRESVPDARLLLVGDFESGDRIPTAAVRRIHDHPHTIWVGSVADVAPYYALMDVLAFPSYREGFPNVPLEAAASGLPVAGFRATGTVDAVVDNVTGTLVGVADVPGLAKALTRYLSDEELRRSHGDAGRRRAREEFGPERIWTALRQEYEQLLLKTGRGVAIPGIV